ncbi:DUF4367 domain-containing protein [Gracilibacillus salitolerans]|uniref:DUF4367 domain-containing protein n=1 Tax=Gracilibacillus salitolerans TaxID=2663022 RepID=A0A5Q2TSN4_9BACI|nr:DUF4367 domain-containing protein [Gracilibacillus salitolerans]QGH35788.1 DUF4367 domain-containing protein [Gracilibacillus salitolerans]
MKFFQHVITTIMILLFLIGCNAQSAIPEGFYSYEKDKVEKAMENLDFSAELPSYVPIAAEILVTDRFYLEELDNEAFDITMFTQNNDIFTIQLINGELYQDKSDFETISLMDSLEGYYQDQPYSQTLHWEKEGVTYQIIYRPSEESLSEKELVKVAESFKSS